jgi:hypothetical protein
VEAFAEGGSGLRLFRSHLSREYDELVTTRRDIGRGLVIATVCVAISSAIALAGGFGGDGLIIGGLAALIATTLIDEHLQDRAHPERRRKRGRSVAPPT